MPTQFALSTVRWQHDVSRALRADRQDPNFASHQAAVGWSERLGDRKLVSDDQFGDVNFSGLQQQRGRYRPGPVRDDALPLFTALLIIGQKQDERRLGHGHTIARARDAVMSLLAEVSASDRISDSLVRTAGPWLVGGRRAGSGRGGGERHATCLKLLVWPHPPAECYRPGLIPQQDAFAEQGMMR